MFAQANNVNITLGNFDEFYERMSGDQTDGRMMREDVLPLSTGLPAPGVEVYCYYGTKVPTVERLVYTDFPTSTPSYQMGDGDGTVNLRSMRSCLRWRKKSAAAANSGRPVHLR